MSDRTRKGCFAVNVSVTNNERGLVMLDPPPRWNAMATVLGDAGYIDGYRLQTGSNR